MGQTEAVPQKRTTAAVCGNRVTQCSLRTKREETVYINLLTEFLSRQSLRDEGGGVRDRTDLQTMYPCDRLQEDFVTPDPKRSDCKFDLEITHDGNVNLLHIDRIKQLDLSSSSYYPVVFPVREVYCDGKDAMFRMHLQTAGDDVESNISKIWRGYKNDAQTQIADTLRTGVDTFSINICRELVQVKYDKVQVIEDRETETNTDMHTWPKCWVIIGFNWVVRRKYLFLPIRDKIIEMCQRMLHGDLSKVDALNELRAKGISPKDERRFLELAGDRGESGIDFEHYFQVMGEHSVGRMFRVYDITDMLDYNYHDMSHVPEFANGTLGECMAKILDKAQERSKNMDNWELFLGWEVVKLSTLEEFLHHATQMTIRNNVEASLGSAMKAVDYLNNRAKHLKLLGADPKQKKAKAKAKPNTLEVEGIATLHERDVGMLFSAARRIMEDAIYGYENNKISRDRFEEQYERICIRMITFCEEVLIPLARQNKRIDYMVALTRTKADYLRHLIIYVSKFRDQEDECVKLYNEAFALKDDAPGWSQAVLSCYVNSACMASEIWRNREEAIKLCRAGREYITEKPGNKPSSSAVFTWSLLDSNMRAFASWIVVLSVKFQEESLMYHAQCCPYSLEEEEQTVEKKRPRPRECGRGYAKDMLLRYLQGTDPEEERKLEEERRLEARREAEAAAEEEAPERAVRRWLKTRPFHAMHFRTIKAVRWIDAVEIMDPDKIKELSTVQEEVEVAEDTARVRKVGRQKRGNAGNDSSDNATGRRSSVFEGTHPTFSTEAEAESPGRTYLIACLIEPRHNQFDKEKTYKQRRKGMGTKTMEDRAGWSQALAKEFEDAFSNWPADCHAESAPRVLEVTLHHDRDVKHLDEAIDEEGMVQTVPGTEARNCKKCNYEFVEQLMWCPECRLQRPSRSFRVGHINLHPGDCMEQRESEPTGCSVELVREGTRPKHAITFYPSLKVLQGNILLKGGYADIHEHFQGFRDKRTNLKFVPKGNVTSLYDLVKLIQEERRALKVPKPPPRRLRGLSARRDPLQAIHRGCN